MGQTDGWPGKSVCRERRAKRTHCSQLRLVIVFAQSGFELLPAGRLLYLVRSRCLPPHRRRTSRSFAGQKPSAINLSASDSGILRSLPILTLAILRPSSQRRIHAGVTPSAVENCGTESKASRGFTFVKPPSSSPFITGGLPKSRKQLSLCLAGMFRGERGSCYGYWLAEAGRRESAFWIINLRIGLFFHNFCKPSSLTSTSTGCFPCA